MVTRDTALEDLPELLRVEELARWADVSTGAVYAAIKAGRLAHVKLGRLTRVPLAAVRVWVGADEARKAS